MRETRPQLQISERKIVLAIGDIAAVLVAVVIALRIWAWVAGDPFTAAFVFDQAFWFAALAGLWLLLASANDFYDLRVAAVRGRTLTRLLIITSQLIIIYVLIFFFTPRDALPRLFIFYYGVASFVTIGIWRLSRPVLLGWVSAPRQTLIVGGLHESDAMIAAIEGHAATEYTVRGIIGQAAEVGQAVRGVPVLGTGADLLNFVRRDGVSELIITATHTLSSDTFRAIMEAYERGVTIMPMSLLYERITGRVPVEHIHDDWAIIFAPARQNDSIFNPYLVFKRTADLVFSVVGLIATAAIAPLLILAIRLDSPGPILYAQERLGRTGTPFRIYKFRSMVQNAEAGTGAQFSRPGDPRVTRIGRFMRKTRLDELPQFWNVLRGDMSLIGPRPERPEIVDRLTQKIPFYRTRLIARPGLTGWAQVRYSYGSTDEDALVKLQYDLYYIRHQSFLLDVNILLRTVGRVLSMSGV
jgi:exopolysaccharide biosynthesis polyprenyl glycosylphosphotransferase